MNSEEFRKIVAPDLATRKAIAQKIKDISYYLIIGLVSMMMMFLVPLISGCLYGDAGLYFPTSLEGWIIYIVLKVGLALGNIAIFSLFKLQAKVNVKDDENFKEANRLLGELIGQKKEYIPRSPKQMNTKEYLEKGIVIFLSTIIASVTISILFISFDLITFLSCIVTTITTVCFSWVTMLKNEQYWTEEYLLYAKMIHKKYSDKIDDQEGGIN